MSAQYVYPGLPTPMPALTLGRTLDGCGLYRQLGDTVPALHLSPGTEFHILAETSDGWRHVCIPNGKTGAVMDVNGTYGYIHRDVMITGASVSALDALEREMTKSTAR